MNIITKIIPYYWIVFTIYAFFRMRFGVFSRIDTVYEISILIYVVYVTKFIKWNLIDKLILLFVIYSFFCCYVDDFDLSLINRWFRAMAFGICGYFIARSIKYNHYGIFEAMKYFFPVICCIALLLYFHPTSWYLNYKLNYEELSDHMVAELTRLSGFWEFPYFISYGSFIYLAYFGLKHYNESLTMKKKMYVCFFVVILACFFAQQRVAIFFVVVLYVLFHILFFLSKRHTIKKLIICDIIIILFMGSSFATLKNVVSSDTYNYIIQRMFENSSETKIISERFEMFKYESSINNVIIGDGFGSHSRSSNSVISDNQYLNIYSELGIIGLVLLYMPIIFSLLKFIKYRGNLFELCILVFYLVAMTGANPINTPDLHPFIFWYCLGLINNSNRYLLTNSTMK